MTNLVTNEESLMLLGVITTSHIATHMSWSSHQVRGSLTTIICNMYTHGNTTAGSIGISRRCSKCTFSPNTCAEGLREFSSNQQRGVLVHLTHCRIRTSCNHWATALLQQLAAGLSAAASKSSDDHTLHASRHSAATVCPWRWA